MARFISMEETKEQKKHPSPRDVLKVWVRYEDGKIGLAYMTRNRYNRDSLQNKIEEEYGVPSQLLDELLQLSYDVYEDDSRYDND